MLVTTVIHCKFSEISKNEDYMAVLCAYKQEPSWTPSVDRVRHVADLEGVTYWVETDGPPPDPVELRRVLGLDVDEHKKRILGIIRAEADAWIATRPIHAEKFAQAMGVLALPGPITDAELVQQFPLIAVSVGIEGATAREVAELFERKYAEAVTHAARVERARLVAEVAVKQASTVQGVREAYEAVAWPTP
jgi:hypothetical protein